MIPSLWIEAPMTAEQTALWTTPEERAYAATFGSERRRVEYLTWRTIVRRELGADVEIGYNDVGAPILINRNIHISVSHCNLRIAVCASANPCAVDIESETRNFSRAASRYMTLTEQSLSDDPLLSGVVWCAKEALYKYAGRRNLDIQHDLRIEQLDLTAGKLVGRIENGEPVELSVCRRDGCLVVYIL